MQHLQAPSSKYISRYPRTRALPCDYLYLQRSLVDSCNGTYHVDAAIKFEYYLVLRSFYLCRTIQRAASSHILFDSGRDNVSCVQIYKPAYSPAISFPLVHQ